jgi:hypothetical protein
MVIGMITMISCKEDIMNQSVDVLREEYESSMSVTIDGESFDTIKLGCFESFSGTENALVYNGSITPNFILRQGLYFKLNENVELKCMVYIFDSIQKYDAYTPEILNDYILNKPDNVVIDIVVRTNGIMYRNQWFDDWGISAFLERDIVDPSAQVSIITYAPIEPDCTEGWPLLPISIEYSGRLASQDGVATITLDALWLELHLMKL